MYQRSGLPWTKYWDFILLDMLSMVLSMVAAYYVYIPTDFNLTKSPEYMLLLLGMPLVDFVAIVLGNTMNEVQKRGAFAEFCATVRNTAVVFAVEALIFFVVKMGGFYSRMNFFYTVVFYFCISYTTRCLYKWYYVKRIVPKNGRSLLIIAAPENIPGLNEKIAKGMYSTYRMAGLILSEPLPEGADCALKVVADSSQAESWIRQNWVDEVLILLAPDEAVLKLADAVTSMGIRCT